MREFKIYDLKNTSQEVTNQQLDNSAGIVMPFYDEDSDLLWLAGKGDGAIRYYEIVPEETGAKMVEPVTAFKSNDPTAAACALPRRYCDVNINEILRIYKITKNTVKPLQFQVPRKSDMFQDDLFPPCRGDEPALTKDEWFGGADATPKLISLVSGFTSSAKAPVFHKIDTTEKELSPTELKKENEALQKRVAYLEAEVAKRDAEIARLQGK